LYFPYLYARRAERNALIDVVHSLGSPQKVRPIVEPYSAASDLTGLMNTFAAAKKDMLLVVNPSRGRLVNAAEQAAWSTAMSAYVADPALVTPVFHLFARTTPADVTKFLTAFAGRELALVILEAGLSAAHLAPLLVGQNIRVFVGPNVAVTDYQTALSGVHVVALAPRFTALRNADFPAESAFSLDPKSYGTAGFGDFTILDPRPPRASGGAGAGAVAVHMTYQHSATNELRVQHFLSDDQVQGTPPDGVKLLQAVKHLDDQQAATPGRFLPSPGFMALHQYRVDGHITNLEQSKRQQISHHLHTVAHSL